MAIKRSEQALYCHAMSNYEGCSFCDVKAQCIRGDLMTDNWTNAIGCLRKAGVNFLQDPITGETRPIVKWFGSPIVSEEDRQNIQPRKPKTNTPNSARIVLVDPTTHDEKTILVQAEAIN